MTGRFARWDTADRQKGVRTALLDHVEARVGDVVVLQLILPRWYEGADEDRVVLRRDEGDSVEPKLGRHDGLNDKRK